MEIVIKNLSELKRPEKNVRLHGDRQIKEYIRSVEMFGQTRPLVIDEKNIVLCGNGLLQTLQQMGRETAECYVVKNLSEKQKKKLMLSDNKIYELGVNDQKVFDEILKEFDGDLDLPGYDEELLKVLTAGAREADEVINSYGKFSEEKISEMGRAKPVKSAPQIQNSVQVTSSLPNQNSEVEEERENFVICPKCGEKIWL